MTTESIEWKSYPDTEPDDGIMVLIHAPDAAEPVWPGYLDYDGAGDKHWYFPNGLRVFEDVTAWAEMPTGKQDATQEFITLPQEMTTAVRKLACSAHITPQELVRRFLHEAITGLKSELLKTEN